jgi:glucose 1-dehydrogenase
MVLTPMNQEAIDNLQVRKEQVQSIPVKRAAEPNEIAHAAVFLASDDARYIHGTTLFIDGGLMQYLGQGA